MSKGHASVVTASSCAAFFILGMLAGPISAQERGPAIAPAPGANKGPPSKVLVPIQTGKGSEPAAETTQAVVQLQQQVRELQGEISTLKGQVSTLQQESQAQQTALQKLQTQFANHHHVVEETFPAAHGIFYGAMYTTMNCPGTGQPCSLNSQGGSGGSTYGIYLFPPGHSPPEGADAAPRVANVTTSGPE